MIAGVSVTPLRQIVDERGKVMHMLKSSDSQFTSFGEVYFSCVYPDVVKAWHLHHTASLNYAVPHGHIKFVLYDDRPDSPTRGEIQELFLGEHSYSLVSVPPKIWNGFKGIGTGIAIVANVLSIVHDSKEIERLPPNTDNIPYDWQLKHK
jgi:dTDP-4-dehydrorhamnose 3,5-epimerase